MTVDQRLLDDVRGVVGRLLASDEVAGVVALRAAHGHIGPHLFTESEEMPALELEPRYPLPLVCQSILDNYPELKLGVVVRGCDQRALIEMAKLGQVDLDRLVLIGLACSAELARQCACDRPYPARIDAGQKAAGVPTADDARFRQLLEMEVEGRAAFWHDEFGRCIKCYGCRNACPVCICDQCVLEEDCWVQRGEIPPEPAFHLIRAYHIADKCVNCGACEASCPMDIPLTAFYALVREQLKALFAYEPGIELAQRSPLTTSLEEIPILGH